MGVGREGGVGLGIDGSGIRDVGAGVGDGAVAAKVDDAVDGEGGGGQEEETAGTEQVSSGFASQSIRNAS